MGFWTCGKCTRSVLLWHFPLIRDYFFISSILKRRYTSHTLVWQRYLRHTCVCRRADICGILMHATNICGKHKYAANMYATNICSIHEYAVNIYDSCISLWEWVEWKNNVFDMQGNTFQKVYSPGRTFPAIFMQQIFFSSYYISITFMASLRVNMAGEVVPGFYSTIPLGSTLWGYWRKSVPFESIVPKSSRLLMFLWDPLLKAPLDKMTWTQSINYKFISCLYFTHPSPIVRLIDINTEGKHIDCNSIFEMDYKGLHFGDT